MNLCNNFKEDLHQHMGRFTCARLGGKALNMYRSTLPLSLYNSY